MEVFRITGNGGSDSDKGILYLQCAIHAREWATSELCSRWAGLLVESYGIDPDNTAVVDHAEIHIVRYANPDGRAISEAGDRALRQPRRSGHIRGGGPVQIV
jgi:carboxypeptidase A2